MWLENPIFQHDLNDIVSDKNIPWEQLSGKTVLVTGGTGLIGYTMISALVNYAMTADQPPRILALVRDKAKAERKFAAHLGDCPGCLDFIVGEVQGDFVVNEPVDYIIHGASPTSSLYFVQHPVETIRTAITGTMNLLELAREKQVSGMIYLSSMEVYGFPEKGTKVMEEHIGALSPLKVRNSYPLGKQQCECLCCAYAEEYGVPAKIIRLTQTFGPGVGYQDGRVFAEFARCVLEHRDIVLKTKGETEREYLYTADAVRAILTVLLKGVPGQAYNAANEATYCSIAQMAQTVADMGGIEVRYELQDAEKLGYAPTLYMDLDTTRLRGLGWQAHTDLKDMYRRMMDTMQP